MFYTRVQEQGWVENLIPPCALSRNSHFPGLDQVELSTGRFLECRRAGCCAALEMRTGSSGERCCVHVLPNLTGGLMPVRGESVAGNPGRLATVGMDALFS